MSRSTALTTGNGFTLVELLVVVTVIVVLISVLAPSLDRAMKVALKAKCLVNQRTIVQGCQLYASDHKQTLPYFPPEETNPSAYDLRSPYGPQSVPRVPGGFGLLPAKGYLPTTQLGKVIHCPLIDNTGAPPDANGIDVRGVGMDRPWIGNWGGRQLLGRSGLGQRPHPRLLQLPRRFLGQRRQGPTPHLQDRLG